MDIEKHIQIGTVLYRYSEGTRQLRRTAQFDLPALERFNPDLIRHFLTDMMAMEPDEMFAPRRRSSATLAPPQAQFVQAMCVLARQLLVDAGLPSFDRELIVSLTQPDPSAPPKATLTIPVIEHIPARIYHLAYGAAFDLIRDLSVSANTVEDIRPKAEALEKDVIDVIRWECGSGPNCVFLLRAAFDRGIQINHVGRSVYQLGTGAHAVLVERSLTQGDASIGARSAKDKWTTSKWLQQSGVPTARSLLVTQLEQAQAFAAHLGYPVVVKPENQDGNKGVTVDVADDDQMKVAFEAAQKFTKFVMVEQRIPGHCHRLVVFRNKFVFAFTRHPKAVVGDGTKTVTQLVEDAQAARHKKAAFKAEKPFPLDDRAVECLAGQGFDPQAVPAADQIVYLRPNNTLDDGGHNETITDKVHPENIKLAERVSRLFRLESMGLDLISTDASRPWYETGACITEVNSMPQIGHNSANAYMEALFGDEKGSVPVHVYVGDDAALEKGRAHHHQLLQDGVSAVLTSHDQTTGSDGQPVIYRDGSTLVERITAALSDTQTEALVIVVQDDELLERGRPMLHVTSARHVNDSLLSFQDRDKSLPRGRIDALIGIIVDGIERPNST